MSDPRSTARAVAPVVTCALAALLIPDLVSAFWLRTFISVAVFALPALGIALLYGRLFVASLAQVALVAIGGWTALRISHQWSDVHFIISVLSGGVVAGTIGAIVGLPAIRIRGLYLALVTLLAAGGVEKVLLTTGFPEGGAGFLGRDSSGGRTAMARPGVAQGDAAYFRYVVVVAAVCFAVVAVVRIGRFGRMWAIIGQGEPAAASVGVNVVWVRTAAFTLAGVLSGIAGGLLAGTIGFLAAPTFTASESVLLFALVLAAGTRSLFGPVVAALLYRAVPSLFDEIGIPGDIATIVFGLLLIHAMITGGDGLTGQVRATWTRLRLRFDDPEQPCRRQTPEPATT